MKIFFLIKLYIGPAAWHACSPWNPHGWKRPGSIKYFAHVKPGRQNSSEGFSPRQKSWDYSDCCDLSPFQGSAQLSPAGSPGPWWSCLSQPFNPTGFLKPAQPCACFWLPCYIITHHPQGTLALPLSCLPDTYMITCKLMFSHFRYPSLLGFYCVTQSSYFFFKKFKL